MNSFGLFKKTVPSNWTPLWINGDINNLNYWRDNASGSDSTGSYVALTFPNEMLKDRILPNPVRRIRKKLIIEYRYRSDLKSEYATRSLMVSYLYQTGLSRHDISLGSSSYSINVRKEVGDSDLVLKLYSVTNYAFTPYAIYLCESPDVEV